eukprot:scaffold4515_cov124-Skeletonema_dohrnii-CCMP3373.AAC.2
MKSSAGACLSQINVVTRGLIDMAMPMAINTFQEGVIIMNIYYYLCPRHVHCVTSHKYVIHTSRAKSRRNLS